MYIWLYFFVCIPVDPNGRSIVAVGQFTKDCIFMHIRAYAIVLLSVDKVSKVKISHYRLLVYKPG